MEIRIEPGLAAKVEQWSTGTGRSDGEQLEDVFASYVPEIAEVRQMLESRYDDMASGRIRPIPGKVAYRILKDRAQARRKSD